LLFRQISSANNEQVTALAKTQQKIPIDKQIKSANSKKTSEHGRKMIRYFQKII